MTLPLIDEMDCNFGLCFNNKFYNNSVLYLIKKSSLQQSLVRKSLDMYYTLRTLPKFYDCFWKHSVALYGDVNKMM